MIKTPIVCFAHDGRFQCARIIIDELKTTFQRGCQWKMVEYCWCRCVSLVKRTKIVITKFLSAYCEWNFHVLFYGKILCEMFYSSMVMNRSNVKRIIIYFWTLLRVVRRRTKCAIQYLCKSHILLIGSFTLCVNVRMHAPIIMVMYFPTPSKFPEFRSVIWLKFFQWKRFAKWKSICNL